MYREQFTTIQFKMEGKFLRYTGTVQNNYNLFLIIENENNKKRKKEMFQLTYSEMQREPMGKVNGGIELRKGKNNVTLIVKDFQGKEVYSEIRNFIM